MQKFTPEQVEKLREDLTRPQLTVKISAATAVRLIDSVTCDCDACADILRMGMDMLKSLPDDLEHKHVRVFMTRSLMSATARVEADRANTQYLEVFSHHG